MSNNDCEQCRENLEIVDNYENGELISNGLLSRKMMTDRDGKKTLKKSEELMYRVGESPPWYLSMAFAFQQLLLGIGSFLTIPLLTMAILCADDSPSAVEYRTSMIGTTCFVAGIATFLQTTFGLRLPVLQGTSGAYFVSALSVLQSDDLKCPSPIVLNPNISYVDLKVFVGENSSIVIHDDLTNRTIVTEQNANYYKDNDGAIRDSNEVWMTRMNQIQGAVICCGLVQIVIGCTGVMGYLVRFIGPLTIAPTLAMITYGILDLILDLVSINWGIAILTVSIFFITSVCMINVNMPLPSCSCQKRKVKCTTTRLPIFSMFPVIFSIGIGWLVCYIVTITGGFSDDPTQPSYRSRTDSSPGIVKNSPWFRFPYPFQFGYPIFTPATLIGMLAAVIPGILESIGDYSATASVCQEPPPPKHAINRGVALEGLGILFAGLFGTGNAATSWSTNIVVIGISRVASRRVFQYLGVLFLILGTFSKFLSVFASLPKVILGGTMLGTFGMLLAVGVSTLRHVEMTKNRNLFVFGFSIVIGMISSMYAAKYQHLIDVGVKQLNNIFRVLISNPMFVSGFTGFVLDNIAPGSRKSRGLETFHRRSSDNANGKTFSAYELPFRNDWNWTQWIPICPRFSPRRFRIG